MTKIDDLPSELTEQIDEAFNEWIKANAPRFSVDLFWEYTLREAWNAAIEWMHDNLEDFS